MRTERTRDESLSDKALVLTLFTRVQNANSGRIGDRLKLQKLCFLLGYPLFRERVKALNYNFFTYRWGPFTKDLYEAETDFEEAGLMERKGDRSYVLTETGLQLGAALWSAIEQNTTNKRITECIDQVVTDFARSSTKQLMDHVHTMTVTPVGWAEEERMDNLPHFLDLTRVLEEEESKVIFELESGWLDALAHVISGLKQRKIKLVG